MTGATNTSDWPDWAVRARGAGISLAALARLTGISDSLVRKYRNGERTPRPEWIASVEQLVTERETAA